jgi:hypothetical protein
MIIDILKHTPTWVWMVLAALLVLGLQQTRPRELTLARVTILPLVFIGVSLYGVFGAFGHAAYAIVAWTAGFGTVAALARDAVAVRGASWSNHTERFYVPGSWLPLTLIVGLFATKYGTGVCLAIHPQFANDAGFMAACSLTYGGFAGSFWARARSLRALTQTSGLTQSA